jgi:hypothetical protein
MMDQHSQTALIIFVRNPILGKVKTRLAKTIGDEKALIVYQLLLNHTHKCTVELPCRKFVYYADAIDEYDLWNSPGYTKRIQQGNDLGDRMKNAFKDLFDQGFKKVGIIGSDCLQLNPDLISAALASLDEYDVVIGPATDGGYYFLGMRFLIPELFQDKNWSTSTVYKETIEEVNKLKLRSHLLVTLCDIDKEADLRQSNIEI